MTSASHMHGTDEHPETAEIAEFSEGLLGPAREAELRAHLAGCASCATVRASLKELREALGSIPAPGGMPADVAERVDTALASEISSTDHAASPLGVSRETAVSRETSRAPARPPGRAPGSTGPGRGRRSGRAQRHRRSVMLSTAGIVAAFGLTGILSQGITDPSPTTASDTESPQSPSALSQQGGGDDALKRRVQALVAAQEPRLKKDASSPGAGANQSPHTTTAPFAGGAASIPSCVQLGIGRPEQPLAVDKGTRYNGTSSYLVVLPHPGDPQRVDAYVVDSTCTASSASDTGEVLLQRIYPRP